MFKVQALLSSRNIRWFKYCQKSLTHQRILIYGAGTAGMGIANILLNEMKEQGLNDKEAKNLFYFVDKQGLLNCYILICLMSKKNLLTIVQMYKILHLSH
uniref:malic enzyme-like NAD(P)-binding protein n=1 Tax=Streptococcus dysgalactiae TaxID=1334 RepID=UPI003703BC72